MEYRTAIVPKHTTTHLARNYDRTTKEQQAGVQQYVDRLEDVAYDVSDVRFPDPEDLPYGDILVQYGGLRCRRKGVDGQ